MSFDEGYCKHCRQRIRGYETSGGAYLWIHWDQKHHDHAAEPSELTLRRLYGDR